MSQAALADDIEPTPQDDVVLEPTAPVVDVESRPAPTLITEHEVAFSTAVALGGLLIASSADPKPKRRHYPPRASYLEPSRMEREMHRL
jgi:hypothetical protein